MRVKRGTMSTDIFIERATVVHFPITYDYSKSIFVNSKTKIIIICNIHGDFTQIPYNHLSGKGCLKCSQEKDPHNLNSLTHYIPIFNLLYNDKYDYSFAVYTNCDTKILIVCPIHGEFNKAPAKHLKQGCPKCSKEQVSQLYVLGNDKFIERANIIHQCKYDYSLVDYKNMNTKINIICLEHGSFLQVPSSHLNGNGCPKCSSSISKKETQWLNSIGVQEQYRQYTIHIDDVWFRVDGFDPDANTVYEFYGDYWHGNVNILPPDKINTRTPLQLTMQQLYDRTLAREQIIKNAGYKMICIWENEFNKLLREQNAGI